MPISGDMLHYIVQGFISAVLVIVRYFWWLILVIFAIRGLESLLRWFGFGRKRRTGAGAARGRGQR